MKPDRRIVYSSLVLAVILALAFVRQLNTPAAKSITPTLTGQPELCLTCHDGIEDISASHPQDAFVCVICHGGNALALDADLAHTGLRGGKNPSDFSVVEASCGGSDCHSGSAADHRDHIQRATTSIQATYAGAIAQVRRSFGAQPDDAARYGIYAVDGYGTLSPKAVPSLQAFDPAATGDPQPVVDFAAACLKCHLTAEPTLQPYFYRSTGCAACHVPYASDGLYRGNYDLRTMTFVERDDMPAPEDLSDRARRLHDYYQPIGQFTLCEWELDCIDCHTSTEAMGDGDLYSSKFDIQYVQCKTCHGTLADPPLTATIDDPNDVELRRARLNGHYTLNVGDTVVATARGEKLGAIKVVDGKFVETLKVSGQQVEIPLVMGSACQQKPDEQESRYCHECHAYDRSGS